MERSVCYYKDVSPGTLQNFRLRHFIKNNRLEHGLRHKKNRIETTEKQIYFALADGLHRKIDTFLLQDQHIQGI